MTDEVPLLPVLDDHTEPPNEESLSQNPSREHSVFDWKNRLAVAVRLALLFLIALGIRTREESKQAKLPDQHVVTLEEAKFLAPETSKLRTLSAGVQEVLDSEGQLLGRVISTVPEANAVVGYRGASHCLLLVNDQDEVTKVTLLSSSDTIEHVELVQNQTTFWTQFVGLQIGDPKSLPDVDAVSGATLTSLAIAEGIALRLGQRLGSLKFPDAITDDEISNAWPELPFKASFKYEETDVVALDADGAVIGSLVRTGPYTDSIAGYQGPTELLIQLDAEHRIQNVKKRRSWDNEPYASYLDDEPWFWDPFIGLRFESLASTDLESLEIEGVSGATMTSVTAAETLIAAATEWNLRQQQKEQMIARNKIHWTADDIGSVIVVFIGCLFAFTRLRSFSLLSKTWNAVLVIYFGLFTGNLVSLVVIFGWSASGIAYRLAPGLTLVVAASFLLPALTKRNVYCSHLCPHGAAQQLLKNRVKRKLRLSKTIMRWLTWIPGALLFLSTATVLVGSTFDLAAIEPFNAYIWYVSGISSLVLAVVSLVWSTAEPMAWCRYGCATGRLLNYARLSASSSKLGLVDGVVLLLTATSLLIRSSS